MLQQSQFKCKYINNIERTMEKNLIKAHDLIKGIERSLNNTTQIQHFCTQLQDLIQYLEPNTSYHYMLFLSEIYATKLNDFDNAKAICKKVIQDKRNSVELQGILRLSFISALQHNYDQAIKQLMKADSLVQKKKTELPSILSNYFYRLFTFSKDSNLLNGNFCLSRQEYQQAMQHFNNELQNQGTGMLIQNKYYAAKVMQKLFSNYPKKTFVGIDRKRCQQFVQQVEDDRDFQEGSNKLEENYINQRKYLQKVIQIFTKNEQNIRNNKIGRKNTTEKFSVEMEQKRCLAILKLTKVIRTQRTNLNNQLVSEFQRCLDELIKGQVKSYTMINDFVAKDFKIVCKANDILTKYAKRKAFEKNPGYQQTLSPNRIRNKIKSNKQSFYGYNSLNNLPKFENSMGTGNKTMHGLTEIKQENSRSFHINKCDSESYQSQNKMEQQLVDFTGSYMEKINESSEGHEKRWFYIVKKQFEKGKFKLYYNSKKEKANSQSDNYYDFKKCVDLQQGKQTKALKRKQCNDFPQNQCFSISMQDKSNRNFYVPDKRDYEKWIYLFKKFQQLRYGKTQTQSVMSKKTYDPVHSTPNINMSTSKLRKTIQFQ